MGSEDWLEEWIQLTQVAGSCEHGDDPSGSDATELVKYESICIKQKKDS
jgi:hypothetical protein